MMGGSTTTNGLRGLWNLTTKSKLKGTGKVGKAFSKLEAAILEEAGIITIRNVGVAGIADGHYMSPVWRLVV